MKKPWVISAEAVGHGLIGSLGMAIICALLSHASGWVLFKVPFFFFLAFLPGVIIVRILRIRLDAVTTGVLYSFGLSVLVLMLSGLIANQFLPPLGEGRPLEFWSLLVVWSCVCALLIFVSIKTNMRPVRLHRWSKEISQKASWPLVGLSFLLPFLALCGAFRLNNGGDGAIVVAALCVAAALIVYMIILRKRLPDALLAWMIFIIGLSVLLMTSLRGWDIVGHDIEREFRVFTLTHMNALWDIRLDRNPYNACLSITILPEVFARLLDISGLVVFKVILQIIFAACPVAIYLLLRQHCTKLAALLGGLLFVCYPTFINDAAMLTRQGVAYFFFALALLMMINKNQKFQHKILFLLCSLGAILSHYSTAYVFVMLFAAAAMCKLFVGWWLRRHGVESQSTRTVLSPFYAVVLFLMTFMWYTQITATSSGAIQTLRESLANIPSMFSDDNKSTDTSAALLFSGGKSQAELYDSYLTSSQPKDTTQTLVDKYLPYLTSDDLPLTPLGEIVSKAGLRPTFITLARQHFARILQFIAVVGVLFAIYRLFRKRVDVFQADFVCLGFAGIVFLALLVALPTLSINYGILRAFHQALIFLLLPIMLFLVWASRRITPKFRTSIATAGIVVLFLMFSGVFAQLLGGVAPHLSMNNSGLYYGLYYSSAADRSAFNWLKKTLPKDNDVRAANFNRAFMHDPNYIFSQGGVLPTQITDRSFVYLDEAQVSRHMVYTHHESSPLIIAFPLRYYEETKNQIYSTTATRIYR